MKLLIFTACLVLNLFIATSHGLPAVERSGGITPNKQKLISTNIYPRDRYSSYPRYGYNYIPNQISIDGNSVRQFFGTKNSVQEPVIKVPTKKVFDVDLSNAKEKLSDVQNLVYKNNKISGALKSCSLPSIPEKKIQLKVPEVKYDLPDIKGKLSVAKYNMKGYVPDLKSVRLSNSYKIGLNKNLQRIKSIKKPKIELKTTKLKAQRLLVNCNTPNIKKKISNTNLYLKAKYPSVTNRVRRLKYKVPVVRKKYFDTKLYLKAKYPAVRYRTLQTLKNKRAQLNLRRKYYINVLRSKNLPARYKRFVREKYGYAYKRLRLAERIPKIKYGAKRYYYGYKNYVLSDANKIRLKSIKPKLMYRKKLLTNKILSNKRFAKYYVALDQKGYEVKKKIPVMKYKIKNASQGMKIRYGRKLKQYKECIPKVRYAPIVKTKNNLQLKYRNSKTINSLKMNRAVLNSRLKSRYARAKTGLNNVLHQDIHLDQPKTYGVQLSAEIPQNIYQTNGLVVTKEQGLSFRQKMNNKFKESRLGQGISIGKRSFPINEVPQNEGKLDKI